MKNILPFGCSSSGYGSSGLILSALLLLAGSRLCNGEPLSNPAGVAKPGSAVNGVPAAQADTAPVVAQKEKEKLARERLVELFELCRKRDYARAASYLVYRGDQKNRKWKETYKYDDGNEGERVAWECDRIETILLEHEDYTFGATEIDKESEGEWVALEVIFSKGEERKTYRFAFLKIGGKYCLGDIDTD